MASGWGPTLFTAGFGAVVGSAITWATLRRSPSEPRRGEGEHCPGTRNATTRSQRHDVPQDTTAAPQNYSTERDGKSGAGSSVGEVAVADGAAAKSSARGGAGGGGAAHDTDRYPRAAQRQRSYSVPSDEGDIPAPMALPRRGISGYLRHDVAVLRDSKLLSLFDTGGFFGVDIGGTLTKLTFFVPDDIEAGSSLEAGIAKISAFMMSATRYGKSGKREPHQSFHSPTLKGTFHFVFFDTDRIEGAVQMVGENGLNLRMTGMYATGGGSFKYAPLFKEKLGIDLIGADELDCCVRGLAFCLEVVPDEAYTYESRLSASPPVPRTFEGSFFPFLLVNIGSGVSVMYVESESKWDRVGGTSVGGGTYFGLTHLLTGATDFDAMLQMADDGDNSTVDLCVGDIYGGNYDNFKLKSSTIASSFGKAGRTFHREDDSSDGEGATDADGGDGEGAKDGEPSTIPKKKPRPQDVSRALLLMVANSIGQVAFLHATRHNCPRVFFAGNFLRHNNSVAMRTLAYAVRFFSKGKIEGLFLKHEGYFGAIGAFLTTLESTSGGRISEKSGKRSGRRSSYSASGKTSLMLPRSSNKHHAVGDGAGAAGPPPKTRKKATSELPPRLNRSGSDY